MTYVFKCTVCGVQVEEPAPQVEDECPFGDGGLMVRDYRAEAANFGLDWTRD